MNVRSWIRREPAPVQIRCDGTRIIAIGTGKRRWADAEDAVADIGAIKLEALDEKGNLLRTCTLDGDGQADGQQADGDKPKRVETVGEIVAVVGSIYREAYSQAFAASGATIESLTAMNANLSAQLAGTQTAFLSAINTLAEERMASAEGDAGGMVGQIMGAAASGLLGGGPPPAAPAKANGAPDKKATKGH